MIIKKMKINKEVFVSLQHENPPSLSTMLKCAGRFFFFGLSELYHGWDYLGIVSEIINDYKNEVHD